VNKIYSNVGKVVLSKDKDKKGLIISEAERYCAICKKNHRCYVIKWEDKTCTKPCEKSVIEYDDDTLIIK